jgi:PEP-CTERM motif
MLGGRFGVQAVAALFSFGCVAAAQAEPLYFNYTINGTLLTVAPPFSASGDVLGTVSGQGIAEFLVTPTPDNAGTMIGVRFTVSGSSAYAGNYEELFNASSGYHYADIVDFLGINTAPNANWNGPNGTSPIIDFEFNNYAGGGHLPTLQGFIADGSVQFQYAFGFGLQGSGGQFSNPGSASVTITFAPAMSPSVPEPSTWAMMILGFCGLGWMAYRRKSGPVRFQPAYATQLMK